LKCKPFCRCFEPKEKATGEEVLMADEFEALKLYEVDGLEQKEAAVKMEISQPTFGRILASAHKKIARAIVGGKTINLK